MKLHPEESDSDPSADVLRQLFRHPDLGATMIDLAAGKTLTHSPDGTARYVYMIISGQVWTYQLSASNNSRLVEILGPGDWFGVAAMAKRGEWRWEATARIKSQILQAPAERLLSLLPLHPAASLEMIQQLIHKLQTARDQAARLMFEDCNQRLVETLVRFSHSAAARQHPEGVALRITHQQLAQAIGAARETISLALTDLKKQDLLRTGRNQLFFNPDTLRHFIKRDRDSHPNAMPKCA